METATVNPYLTGNFAPVRDERDDADLEVTGALPPELDGLLIRNGPNPVVDPDPALYHWFVGDGMLHGIELTGGRARYRNRWVRTDGACEALGEAPPSGQPDDVFVGGSSVANTAVTAHRGRIFALVEVALPTEVRADLSTIGRNDFGGALRSAMTAHPKYDPLTGELVFFGYDIMGPPWLRYHVLDADGALVTDRGDHDRRPGDDPRLRDDIVARRLDGPPGGVRPLDARPTSVPRGGIPTTRHASA